MCCILAWRVFPLPLYGRKQLGIYLFILILAAPPPQAM